MFLNAERGDILKIEIRSAGEIRVSGYVNAVERDSKVLPAEMACGADSQFVEKVRAGAFKRAISRNPNVRLYFNHEREIGSVSGGELRLFEDNIGLHADAVITDPEIVSAAKRGELRGWSFGFSGAKAEWEPVSDKLKRRTLTDFDLSEVSILTKSPAYFGTSVEMRGEDRSVDIREVRAFEDAAEIIGIDLAKNPSETGRFFNIQKQLELLKLKGEI